MANQALSPGSTLRGGKYKIRKILGQGSFGITYLASAKISSQGNLGTMEVEVKVAIKEFFMSEVNGRQADGSSVDGSSGSVFTNYRRKFRKEAENLAGLKHSNIVRVFDVFDENNTTYYAMEYIDGSNLDDYIRERGSIPEHEALNIIAEIGGAVTYMHSRKMLHLDIKPKNIMRKAGGTGCLIDFGLSKQFTDDGEPESSTSIGLGTPGYAPIEQAGYTRDGSFPATLDIYALGATLFKMLTGKRLPEATYILNDGFPDAMLAEKGICASTRAAVKKAMAPLRKDRFQDVRSFIDALGYTPPTYEDYKDDKDEATVIDQPSDRPEQEVQKKSATPVERNAVQTNSPRRSIPAWILALICCVVVGVVLVLVWPHNGDKTVADENEAVSTVESNYDIGRKFLAANSQRAGVAVTSSGLQYEVLKAGDGPKPNADDVVTVRYTGKLPDGTVFDSAEEPVSFKLSAVIKGWQEALQLMKAGSEWRLFIPSELAYGSSGAGDLIPPDQVLIFDVTLLDIAK